MSPKVIRRHLLTQDILNLFQPDSSRVVPTQSHPAAEEYLSAMLAICLRSRPGRRSLHWCITSVGCFLIGFMVRGSLMAGAWKTPWKNKKKMFQTTNQMVIESWHLAHPRFVLSFGSFGNFPTELGRWVMRMTHEWPNSTDLTGKIT